MTDPSEVTELPAGRQNDMVYLIVTVMVLECLIPLSAFFWS
jgi:hypothetical protein